MPAFTHLENKQSKSAMSTSFRHMTMSAVFCLGSVMASGHARAADIPLSVSAQSVAESHYALATSNNQDNPEDIYRQALAYHEGKGVMHDIAKAKALLLHAAKLGHIESQYTLGVISEDEDKSMFWLNEAASQGHEQAGFAYQQLASFDYGVGC